MNIVKETLQNQLTEIENARYEKETQFKKELSNRGMDMLSFMQTENFNVTVESDRIQIHIPEISSWSAIEICRNSNYKDDMPKYQEPKLKWGSGNTNTEFELKYIMNVAKIAERFLNKDNWWNALVGLMDEMSEYYSSEEYKTLRNQERELEKTIRNIEQTETLDKFTSIFNKGSFKLNKSIRYDYGSSRYDYVDSDEWIWAPNGTGKTYTLYYSQQHRINPNYDEQGNYIQEAVYETRKHEIPKRVRKEDLFSFIKYNMDKVKN